MLMTLHLLRSLAVVLLGLGLQTSAVAKQLYPPNQQVTLEAGRPHYKGQTPNFPDPSNPSNEVDFVGQLHNQALDFIISNKNSLGATPNLWRLNMQRLTAEFVCANQVQIDLMTSMMVPGTLPDDCSMTSAEVGILDQLYSLQDAATSMGITNFINAVKQLEAVALAQPMSSREKVNLMGAFSVARYSGAYWYAESQKAASAWGSPPFNPPAPFATDWGGVGKADLGGAIGGGYLGLAGGPLGWLLLPEIMIAGAAISSAAAAFG